MNNFTYYNDEWNPPIVEGTSQPPLASQLPPSFPAPTPITSIKTKNV
jgi:hypothetical protein